MGDVANRQLTPSVIASSEPGTRSRCRRESALRLGRVDVRRQVLGEEESEEIRALARRSLAELVMKVPTEIEFRGLVRSALLESAARNCAAALDPLAGWVVACRITLRTAGASKLRAKVTLVVPTGRLTTTSGAFDRTPSSCAEAITRALTTLLREILPRARRPEAGAIAPTGRSVATSSGGSFSEVTA